MAKTANRKYTVHKIGHSKSYIGANCSLKEIHYYQYIQLCGNTKAIKKVNKVLEREAKKFMKDKSFCEGIKLSAEENEVSDEYSNYIIQKVSFLSKHTVSIRVVHQYYGGFGGHRYEFGFTFNLKTGKRIYKLTDVTNTRKLSSLKSVMREQADSKGLDLKECINEKNRSKDFEFYINKRGNIIVCFENGPKTDKLYLRGAAGL